MQKVVKVSEITEITEKMLKKEYGEDFKYEDGDEFFFAFNNCTVRTYLIDGTFGISISGNETIHIDADLDCFVSK